MKVLYLKPHRVVLEAESQRDRDALPGLALWLESNLAETDWNLKPEDLVDAVKG